MANGFEEDYDFNPKNYKRNSFEENYKESRKLPGLTSVFGYMFLGLLLTGAIATSLPYLLLSIIKNPETAFETYIILMIVSMIASLIMVFVAQFVCIKRQTGGLACFLIYSALMGVLMSAIMLAYDMTIIGYAFVCASGAFGIMALYGLFTKGSTKLLGYIGFGMLGGILLLTLAYFILGLFGIEISALGLIISALGIIMMLAFTAYDVNRAKRMAESGTLTNNLAAYFALQIYTDFVYLFIRILSILSRFTKKN